MPSQYYVRPITLVPAILHRLERVLGVGDTPMTHIPVHHARGETLVWPVTLEQLYHLTLLSELVHRTHFLVFTMREGEKARFATSAFLEELARRGKPGIKIQASQSKQTSEKKGCVRSPTHDYFIRVEGDFPLTLKEFLESQGMSIDEGSFVSLPVWYSTMRVLALPVEKTILLALYAANKLNRDWRQVSYLQRPKSNPDATAEQVPPAVFHPNKETARKVAAELRRDR